MSRGRKLNLGHDTHIDETSRTILLGRCLFSTPVYERQTRWKRRDQANVLYEQRKKLKRPFVKCFTWHDINSSYRWLDTLSLNYDSLNRTVIKNCRQSTRLFVVKLEDINANHLYTCVTRYPSFWLTADRYLLNSLVTGWFTDRVAMTIATIQTHGRNELCFDMIVCSQWLVLLYKYLTRI